MKPLLAEKVDLDNLKFPYMVSSKYDGFRCLCTMSGPVTRSMKPIPNAYVQGKLAEWNLVGLDGELLTYTGSKLDDFNVTQSKLSSRSGQPDFKFMVFDHFLDPNLEFAARLLKAQGKVESFRERSGEGRVEHVKHILVRELEHLMELETQAVADGWEGVMLRDPRGHYKHGRSTVKEGILLKMKRVADDEGVVVGYRERVSNQNEATRNVLGYQERSSHRANMLPCGDLGALELRWRDVTFEVGTGFDMAQRRKYWAEGEALLGKTVTFGYEGVGTNGRPRFPRFRGFRVAEDLS